MFRIEGRTGFEIEKKKGKLAMLKSPCLKGHGLWWGARV
jgi:hypothetical protein